MQRSTLRSHITFDEFYSIHLVNMPAFRYCTGSLSKKVPNYYFCTVTMSSSFKPMNTYSQMITVGTTIDMACKAKQIGFDQSYNVKCSFIVPYVLPRSL